MERVSIDGLRDLGVDFVRKSQERICFFGCEEVELNPLTVVEVVVLSCLLVVEVGLLPPLLGEFPSRGLPSGDERPAVERLCGDALLPPATKIVLLEVGDCRMGKALVRRGPELEVFGGEGSGDIVELFVRKVLPLAVAFVATFVVLVAGLEVALAVEDFIRKG